LASGSSSKEVLKGYELLSFGTTKAQENQPNDKTGYLEQSILTDNNSQGHES
jgi:hypothetical protein